MADFDDLRKQAEQLLGKDAARRLESELQNRMSGSKDDFSHIIDVDRVRFKPDQNRRESGFGEYDKKDREISEKATSEVLEAKSKDDGYEREKAPQLLISEKAPEGAKAVQPSEGSSSERLIATAIKGEYSYAKLGLSLGLATILGGIILGLNGVAGSTSWTAKLLGLESKINDAAPGGVLFIVGIFYVWTTRPKVKLKDLNG